MRFNWHGIGYSAEKRVSCPVAVTEPNSFAIKALHNGLLTASEDYITKECSRFLCHH
jgi:hypothetical protein